MTDRPQSDPPTDTLYPSGRPTAIKAFTASISTGRRNTP